jgi:adenosylmethionine-8-amino-7-oxononanoate aminotransferase
MAIADETSTATTAYWHPFADMGAVSRSELVIERGEGVYVYDADGKRYLDGTASLWYANLGYGRREVADAVAAQMAKLEAYQTFGDFANPPANALAARLSALAPMEDAKVFLASGGGDAIDTAAKIARRHWILQGQPERIHLLSRTNGYHGTHGFGTSIGGIEANTANWGPLVPHASAVAFDSLPALEQEILRIGPERVAAFFCEPVIGAGGVHLPPDGYIEGAADLCAEHGILFVCDSVICAFGRLGTWFGIERWPDVKPDMITFAKGVTSGILPLGGVIASGEVAAPFFGNPGGPMLRHGATYAGHPTCCAAALAVLDIYEAEGLIERGRELEGALRDALAPLASHDAVGEVRAGLGLLAAVALSDDALTADPGAVAKLAAGARAAGVIVRPLLRGVAVSPPLVIDESHLAELADGISAGLGRL